MKKKLYIGFNHNLGSHDLSLSGVSEYGFFSISLERLYRIKQAPNIKFINNKELYHKKALDLLFEGVELNKFQEIVIVNYPGYKNSSEINGSKVIFIEKANHHYLHAASGFYASDFKSSAVLSVDGSGIDEESGVEEMQTIWYGDGNYLVKKLSTELDNKNKKYGIGTCYYLHSDFLGMSEGTFMGLSSYGDANRYKNIEIFKYENGEVYLDSKFLQGTKKEAKLGLFNNGEYTQFYAIRNLMNIYGVKDSDLIDRKNNITTSIFADIAAKVQHDTEKAMVYLANHAYKLTKSKNLCLSGGVALNCVANSRIINETPFEKIFVQPACNDQGLSLGAALYGYYDYGNNKKRVIPENYGIGPSYSSNEILRSFEDFKGKFIKKHYTNFNDLIIYIGKELHNNKIIAWFQGGSEFGSRALGFRSILASPCSEEVRDRVNDIKLRERWRPLAPVIMEDYLNDYFDTKYISPYMNLTSYVLDTKKQKIPGVVHIDGTARYQTVNSKENNRLYNLINSFYRQSGVPILINTSFNSAGEPIIENPNQAIKMFLSTDIDYLILGEYLLSKDKIFSEYKFDLNSYKLGELKKYGRKPNSYFNDVYVKLWKIIYSLIFNLDENISISYSDLFNDNIIEFKYGNHVIVITIGYHNYFNYYYYSLLGVAVKGKNVKDYPADLIEKLDKLKLKLLENEEKIMYYFDKYNNEFYDKYE